MKRKRKRKSIKKSTEIKISAEDFLAINLAYLNHALISLLFYFGKPRNFF
jgi:hypothetical protein